MSRGLDGWLKTAGNIYVCEIQASDRNIAYRTAGNLTYTYQSE